MKSKNLRVPGNQKKEPEVVDDDDSAPAGVHVVAKAGSGNTIRGGPHIHLGQPCNVDDALLEGCLRVLL